MTKKATWGGRRKGAGRPKSAKPKTRRVMIRLDDATLDWAQREAERLDISVSEVLRQAVERARVA